MRFRIFHPFACLPPLRLSLSGGLLLLAAGCMTPERAVRESDRIGDALAADARSQILGTNASFTVQRPSDRLRARLMIAQELPGSVSTGGVSRMASDPLELSLLDALRIGAANDARYQATKEDIFQAALELDLQRHGFESNFSGLLFGGADRTTPVDGGSESRATGGAKAGIERKLSQGATVAANLAWDVVRLLTGDVGTSLALVGDATLSMPLLRGAGRDVVLEPLTQAGRNLVYALHDFEAYRQDYAVRAAAAYYDVLEATQQLRALEDNEKLLADSLRRAQFMFDAGRLPQIQVDQTSQNVLQTGDQLVRSRQAYEGKLDQLKVTLGLPADARIGVTMVDLTRLQRALGFDPDGTNTQVLAEHVDLPWTESQAINFALTNRHDLAVVYGRLEDARRAVLVAADALRMDLDLVANASFDKRQATGGGGGEAEGTARKSGVNLSAGLPWERTAERNAYRGALLALDAASRAVEIAEDSAKSSVRSDLRGVQASWSSIRIQLQAVEVALRRVRSTSLFQEAGRAEMRDVLEAQDSLLTARTALVSAIVRYRLAGLELQRDIAALEISEEGLWREPDAELQP